MVEAHLEAVAHKTAWATSSL